MSPSKLFFFSNHRTVGLLALSTLLALYATVILLAGRPVLPPLDPLPAAAPAATDETHVAFAILGSPRTLARRVFVETWWRPNRIRGLIWLEPSQQQDPWPPTCPPSRVFRADVPVPLQMTRVVRETFDLAAAGGTPFRWLVLGDDDTVFFVDNLVEVLRRYDHEGFFYIGGESESAIQNSRYRGMAFGGGGVALSARLVRALLPILDRCLARYQGFRILDQILHACISELGVSLTLDRGFHQVDLKGNVSGYLSAHPQVPAVSLHHVELVEPIIPTLGRAEALRRLMGAARADASRLLQQSFCYDKARNWTLAVSFGYSVHVHEMPVEPRVLQQPLQTFRPWRRSVPPFSFETRQFWRDACGAPHEFYVDGVEEREEEEVVSRYARFSSTELPLCGNHSANAVERVTVLTPKRRRVWVGGRRECCEVISISGDSSHALLRIRQCMEGETIFDF